MPDKRVEALNSLNRNDYNSKYITLSDNTKIGVDLIKDLIRYFQLEFKNKYRYNYSKWALEEITDKTEIYDEVTESVEGAESVESAEDAKDAESAEGAEANQKDKIIYKIIDGEGDDKIAIDKLKRYINKIFKNGDSYIEIPEKDFVKESF